GWAAKGIGYRGDVHDAVGGGEGDGDGAGRGLRKVKRVVVGVVGDDGGGGGAVDQEVRGIDAADAFGEDDVDESKVRDAGAVRGIDAYNSRRHIVDGGEGGHDVKVAAGGVAIEAMDSEDVVSDDEAAEIGEGDGHEAFFFRKSGS